MVCTNCDGKVAKGVKFCSGCGKATGSVSNEPVASVLQSQTITAAEKFCFSCGSVIKKEAEICPKCGVRQNAQGGINSKEQPLKEQPLAIVSIILISIGFVLYIVLKFFPYALSFPYDLSKETNEWGRRIVWRYWWNFRILTLYGGMILAFISLYKTKNKIIMIAGIIASAIILFLYMFG